MSAEGMPRPRIDGDNARFWESARSERLEIQRCAECGTLRYYPRELCPNCWSELVEWTPINGRGTVYSWAVVRRAPVPALEDKIPYVVALVDLEEGVRVFSRIHGAGDADVAIGAPVHVVYEPLDDEITLPLFELSEGAR